MRGLINMKIVISPLWIVLAAGGGIYWLTKLSSRQNENKDCYASGFSAGYAAAKTDAPSPVNRFAYTSCEREFNRGVDDGQAKYFEERFQSKPK